MKKNFKVDALLMASSLLLATTAHAGPTKVGKVPIKADPDPKVCGEVLIHKVVQATDLFTDCPDQAQKCLDLLQANLQNEGEFKELFDDVTKAAAKECIQKFENELFGAE